jgi:uncharacterized membrane protein
MAIYNGVLRDMLKTLSYRIVGSATSFILTYLATNNYKVGIGVGLGDFLIKPMIYFAHERIWRKIK